MITPTQVNLSLVEIYAKVERFLPALDDRTLRIQIIDDSANHTLNCFYAVNEI